MLVSYAIHLRDKKALNQDLAEGWKATVQKSMVENTNVCLHKIQTKHLQKKFSL